MLGTCCASCLPAKVRAYALDAENGAVTVKPIENPLAKDTCSCIIGYTGPRASTGTAPEDTGDPVYCGNLARFTVSYHKKTGSIRAGVLSADKIIGRDDLRV